MPAPADSLQNALSAMRSGRWPQAETALRRHLMQHRDPEAQRLLAVVLLQQGMTESALEAVEQALSSRPDWSAAETNRGSILRALGRTDEARASFERAAELDPRLAAPLFNLGKMLKADARLAAARTPLREAVRREPGHAAAWTVLGEVEKALGDVDAAVAAFHQARSLRPETGAAWWGLANLKTWRCSAEDRMQLDRLWTQTGIARRDRELIGFARAHAAAQLDPDGPAWQALMDANAFRRSSISWRASEHSARVDRLIAAYRDAPEPDRSGMGAACIFIVGLPRSGSTLVEQILAGHSQVAGASELPDLPELVADATRARGERDETWLARAENVELRALGEAYLQRTARWRQHAPVSVDKLPENFLRIGTIWRMLPGARIVDCRRDARDTALSCLYQFFAHGSAWTYDLEEIGAYYRDYVRLMAHWKRVRAGALIQVAYEELVADPHASISALLASLGLPFEAGCLRPEQVRREVRTASAAQVIQAIDQRGVGRWKYFAGAFAAWSADGP